MGLMEAKTMCEKYKGKMSIITSSEMQESLFSQLQPISDFSECYWSGVGVWTGFTDRDDEGNFVDINEGRDLSNMLHFQPFFLGQPNGHTSENCASADSTLPYTKSWYDTRCDRSLLSFCKISQNIQVQIRGKRY